MTRLRRGIVSIIGVTGAAGSLAADIIPGLIEAGYTVVGIDQVSPENTFGCDWAICSINDRISLQAALEGCDAIIHLAGIPLEADWHSILGTNIDGTQAVLESARLLQIDRVVLASSIHATGYVPVPSDSNTVADDVPVRPDTFYGVSKATVEALGSLYHDRFGMDVICIRIASRFDQPQNERMLSTWLSPTDAVRLVHACLTTRSPGFRLVWGMSANTRRYLSANGGNEIGYVAQDDAEVFAESLFEDSVQNPSLLASQWDHDYLGGIFSSPNPPRFRLDVNDDSTHRASG